MSKIALITGANRGLGLETARQLAAQNFTVVLGSRDKAKGEAATQELREAGFDAHPVQLEVADPNSVERATREVEEKFGHLDALINNAGINVEFKADANGAVTQILPTQLSIVQFRETFDTNLFGVFSVTRAFLPLLRRAPAARIVNLSSVAGSLSQSADPQDPAYELNTLAYRSSKAALNALTIAFAKELRDTSIKVNSAHPGWVKTDMGTVAAPRALEDGPRIIVTLATLPADGPTGGFFDENGPVAW